jgi:hypothetical protein
MKLTCPYMLAILLTQAEFRLLRAFACDRIIAVIFAIALLLWLFAVTSCAPLPTAPVRVKGHYGTYSYDPITGVITIERNGK